MKRYEIKRVKSFEETFYLDADNYFEAVEKAKKREYAKKFEHNHYEYWEGKEI